MNLKSTLTALALILAIPLAQADVGGSSSSSGYESEDLPDSIVELVNAEDFAAAIPALEDFIADESRNADAWNLLGYSQRKMGLFDDSGKSYKKALKLDKKHLGALEYQGELYLNLDNAKKAKKNLKKLKKLCGNCEEYQHLAEAIEKYEAG